jgi:hypothetical protein
MSCSADPFHAVAGMQNAPALITSAYYHQQQQQPGPAPGGQQGVSSQQLQQQQVLPILPLKLPRLWLQPAAHHLATMPHFLGYSPASLGGCPLQLGPGNELLDPTGHAQLIFGTPDWAGAMSLPSNGFCHPGDDFYTTASVLAQAGPAPKEEPPPPSGFSTVTTVGPPLSQCAPSCSSNGTKTQRPRKRGPREF